MTYDELWRTWDGEPGNEPSADARRAALNNPSVNGTLSGEPMVGAVGALTAYDLADGTPSDQLQSKELRLLQQREARLGGANGPPVMRALYLKSKLPDLNGSIADDLILALRMAKARLHGNQGKGNFTRDVWQYAIAHGGTGLGEQDNARAERLQEALGFDAGDLIIDLFGGTSLFDDEFDEVVDKVFDAIDVFGDFYLRTGQSRRVGEIEEEDIRKWIAGDVRDFELHDP